MKLGKGLIYAIIILAFIVLLAFLINKCNSKPKLKDPVIKTNVVYIHDSLYFPDTTKKSKYIVLKPSTLIVYRDTGRTQKKDTIIYRNSITQKTDTLIWSIPPKVDIRKLTKLYLAKLQKDSLQLDFIGDSSFNTAIYPLNLDKYRYEVFDNQLREIALNKKLSPALIRTHSNLYGLYDPFNKTYMGMIDYYISIKKVSIYALGAYSPNITQINQVPFRPVSPSKFQTQVGIRFQLK